VAIGVAMGVGVTTGVTMGVAVTTGTAVAIGVAVTGIGVTVAVGVVVGIATFWALLKAESKTRAETTSMHVRRTISCPVSDPFISMCSQKRFAGVSLLLSSVEMKWRDDFILHPSHVGSSKSGL